MYFERNRIIKVKESILARGAEIGVLMIDDDFQMYLGALEGILTTYGRQYNQGEQLEPEHYNALMSWVKGAVENSANAVINGVKNGKVPQNSINDPVEHLLTVADYFYVVAMEKLGCPDMPIFASDKELKKVIQESALKMDQVVNLYDFSSEKEFERQRGINAKELQKSFNNHEVAISKKENLSRHLGEMIAEYQALKQRQSRHGAIWRLFHSGENKERNALLGNMEKTIQTTMKDYFFKESLRKLDALNPSEVARSVANARIIEAVGQLGAERFEEMTKRGVESLGGGVEDSLIEKNSKREKVPMTDDKEFMSEIGDKKADISAPIKENKEIVKDNVKV